MTSRWVFLMPLFPLRQTNAFVFFTFNLIRISDSIIVCPSSMASNREMKVKCSVFYFFIVKTLSVTVTRAQLVLRFDGKNRKFSEPELRAVTRAENPGGGASSNGWG